MYILIVEGQKISGVFELFFFNDTATTEIYTLSLHDALPISAHSEIQFKVKHLMITTVTGYFTSFNLDVVTEDSDFTKASDRKSTRLNSSHANISYAVFCLKKKQTNYYLRYPLHNSSHAISSY